MVERRQVEVNLVDSLEIDKDDIDACLVEQAGLFWQVAEAAVDAASTRDAAKLELEHAEADLYKQFRKAALDNGERITEAAINNMVRSSPRIQNLERHLLDVKTKAERKAALKESYQQRSYMLRELNTRDIAFFHNLNTERGVGGARTREADRIRRRHEEQDRR